MVIFANYIRSLFLTEQIIAKKNLTMDKFSKDCNGYINLEGIDEKVIKNKFSSGVLTRDRVIMFSLTVLHLNALLIS